MNQYKCTYLDCKFSCGEAEKILYHIEITHTLEPFFNFECVNRLPNKCRRKFLSYEGIKASFLQNEIL